MYNWRLSSFVVFTALFWTVSVVSTGTVWFVLASIFGGKSKARHVDVKREEDYDESESTVKEESDDETRNPHFIKPKIEDDSEEQPGFSPLTSEQEEDDDDDLGESTTISARSVFGSGTGFQRPSGLQIQRRRSHFREELS